MKKTIMTIQQKFQSLPAWLSPDFKQEFGYKKYIPSKTTWTNTELPRDMTDAEIEAELKPNYSTSSEIADYLASPEVDKDHYLLFYMPSCVVCVDWYADCADWDVGAWRRSDDGWHAGGLVLSPAN